MVGVARAEPHIIEGVLMYLATHGEPRAAASAPEHRSPTLAQMVAHPRLDTHGAWLDLHNGAIVVKNPDDVLLAKMCAIAERLGAQVQGEDGGYYTSDGHVRDGAAYLTPWRRTTTDTDLIQ